MKEIKEFEATLQNKFTDKNLLEQAFIHRSYLNENRNVSREHNERLEFLGDAVLELVVTRYLYDRYPEKPEGDLTALRSALVNAVTLSQVASELRVNDYILLSKGEAKDMGRARNYILADALEAIIGAIYLDQGYDNAEKFIHKNITVRIDEIVKKKLWIDSKSKFQEIAQERVGITPAYRTVRESGPDHDKIFTVGLYLADNLVSEGSGKSKQEAEQEAARVALHDSKWK